MTSIIYTVTDRALSAGRLSTEQTFVINRLTEFTPPMPTFNRPVAHSMDRRSFRGTNVSNYETSSIGITVPISELASLNELIYSLADYQIAEIDATDVDYVNAVRQFVMIGDSFPREIRGCTHISGSLQVQFLP